MRMRILFYALALTVGIGMQGCENSTPPSTGPESRGLSVDNAGAPPTFSGIVYRGSTPMATTVVDLDSGLRSIIGIPGRDLCLGTSEFQLMDYSEVFLQNPSHNNVMVFEGKIYAEVWPAGPFDCGTYVAQEPLARGIVKYVRTDNDWDLDGGRMNAYGWRATGTLYGPDGSPFRFSEVVLLQWPDGAFENMVRNLSVQLVPIEGRGLPDVSLNEVFASHAGLDDKEYVELCGEAGAPLDNLWVVVIEGQLGLANPGSIDRAWPLGGRMPDDGYFVLADDGVANQDYSIGSDNSLENGTETVLLVHGFLLEEGTDVDRDNDGLAEVAIGTIVDGVGLVGNVSDFVYYSVPALGPDGSFFPAGVARCSGCSGDFNTFMCFNLNSCGWGNVTPGTANDCP